MSDPDGEDTKDYSVGYGRPPIHTRFQPGKSGNPRGRPKGQKSIGQVLAEALSRRIAVNENGRQRTMRMQDVIVQGLVNDAAKRDSRATKLLFALMDRYSGEQDDVTDALPPDDRAILEAYLHSASASADAGRPADGSFDNPSSENPGETDAPAAK